jgi:hypothetical protein
MHSGCSTPRGECLSSKRLFCEDELMLQNWEACVDKRTCVRFFCDDKCSTFRAVYNYTLMGSLD